MYGGGSTCVCVWMFGCIGAQVYRRIGIWVYGCMGVGMVSAHTYPTINRVSQSQDGARRLDMLVLVYGCMVAWLYGCVGAWMTCVCGCMSVRVYECVGV